MPTAVASWRARTYCGPPCSTRASSRGSSVVPGLPKTWVTPSLRMTSRTASRPRRVTAGRYRSARARPHRHGRLEGPRRLRLLAHERVVAGHEVAPGHLPHLRLVV